MGTEQVHFSVALAPITCCECGIVFGVPTALATSLRKSHKLFYCPAGHSQYFTSETEVERLTKQNESLRKKMEWAQRAAQLAIDEAIEITKKLQAANEERGKLKKRIKEGVCPCCHRTFSNLREHVAMQHPGFGDEVWRSGAGHPGCLP